MNPDHLVELAGQIIHIGTGHPRQAAINRAISTAYYAVFRAVAGECVARTVRSPRSPRYWEIVTPVHRSLEHASARKVFERALRDRTTSQDLSQLAEAFIALQAARQSADYDPGSRYSRRAALDFIDQARRAIEALRTMPPEDRLLLAVQLITRSR